MSEQGPLDYEDVLTTHSYDGIQEFDNPMPLWWKATFVVTIIWSGFYVVAMETGMINTYETNLDQDKQELASVRSALEQERPPVTEELLVAAKDDAGAMANGAKVYASTCASCHGPEGQGLIGPNLTDKFWIHGGSPTDIHAMVTKGAPTKGMPAWENIISHDDAIHVTAYIMNMQGTSPANPKEPQGEEYSPN